MRDFRPYLLAGLLAAGAIAGASARDGLDSDTTGTLPPVLAKPEPPLPWSGHSGASGDPTMTADAILVAAADFHLCLERLWPLAARHSISRSVYAAYTSKLTPDLRIMDLLDSQPEFTKSFWDYLDILVTDERITRGNELLEKYRGVFDAVERDYGVDRYILTAIWGVETNYGTAIGDRPVIRSTATLACIGRRQHYFRDEFIAALEILQNHDIRPDRLVGSWAGAFGPTQFMPTAFKRYAIDFDHDGRRDVVDSVSDVMASTANNLKKDGWVTGHTWGYEVVVPANFNFMLADRTRWMAIRDWERLGIRRAGGKAFPRADDRAFLLVPAGVQGPGFLMLENFRVLMRYNPAEAYALAIGHLADRLRGSEPFVQNWPRYERMLSRDELLELQQLLARRGYNVEADGHLGVQTRSAIRAFQARNGQIPDGFASAEVLDKLRAR